MTGVEGHEILLNAPPMVRSLTIGGDDDALRSQITDRVAGLCDQPPLLVLTSSCSSALDAAATLVGVGPGDEVVVSAFTFPTSASPYLARGATVRFADVDPATANVTPETVTAVLTERTRAIVVTHYAGVEAEITSPGRALAEGIEVVEDAAHGLFASTGGRPLGRAGRFGALSFHRTKNISAIEGGALIVNDPADVDAALVAIDKGTNRVQFDRGQVSAYEWMGIGSSWRMPEASVRYLAAELEQADAIQARRHAVVAAYQRDLEPWAQRQGLDLPSIPTGSPAHIFHLVLPTGSDRDRFVAHCAARGVQTARHYGSLPDSRFGRTVRHPDDRCPNAAHLGAALVRLPLHHELTDQDVARVVSAVSSFEVT